LSAIHGQVLVDTLCGNAAFDNRKRRWNNNAVKNIKTAITKWITGRYFANYSDAWTGRKRNEPIQIRLARLCVYNQKYGVEIGLSIFTSLTQLL
tara:strand:- start:760 stop:1041 length:282 start_codon:yes stop_codon:yes gene_type:complete